MLRVMAYKRPTYLMARYRALYCSRYTLMKALARRSSMRSKLKQLEAEHIMQTYKRLDLVLEKGTGCYVYDTSGKRYLDFVGGIATCSIGHSNPAITKAITEQAERLISVSNLYYTEPQILLA